MGRGPAAIKIFQNTRSYTFVPEMSFSEYGSNANAYVVMNDFCAVHRMWHNSTSEIRSDLKREAQRYDEVFARTFGRKSNWPMRILMELPSMSTEREAHCTGARVAIINKISRKIFVEQHEWHLFALENITRSISYSGRGTGDGMHTGQEWLWDVFRVWAQLVLNTLQSGN